MTFLLLLFFISLGICIWMITNRIIQIQRGYVDPNIIISDQHTAIQTEVAKIEKIVIQSLKRFFHYMAVTIMKGWVIVSHLTDKKIRERFPRTYNRLFEKNTDKEIDPNIPKRTLMNTVREYRFKMKMFRKKLREEDELK